MPRSTASVRRAAVMLAWAILLFAAARLTVAAVSDAYHAAATYGFPVMRESQAIWDIFNTGTKCSNQVRSI
jgi:hypothetical protein